jgi:tRNA modification GTPase
MHSETIAALATARGPSALAVVRLSGPAALDVVDRLFLPAGRLTRLPGQACAVGHLVAGAERVDQVVVTLFRAPHSFTGEDLVEITCHGGDLTPGRVLDLVLASDDVRPAREGEFTLRAFLNGKLDLSQAEAVEALITARSVASARAALRVLGGDLRRSLEASMESLTSALARLEVSLDVQEDGAPDVLSPASTGEAGTRDIAALLSDERARMTRLLAGGRTGRLLDAGLRVVFVGRPNAGKSSLLNALLALDRAIVSPVPGTTRDVLEAPAVWAEVPLVLVDTAGLRAGGDPVEQEGVRRAREAIRTATLVVHVVDVAATTPASVAADVKLLDVPREQCLIALHKWDLPPASGWTGPAAASARAEGSADADASAHADLGARACVHSSTIDAPGVESLRAAIVESLRKMTGDSEETLLVADRQCALMTEALQGLDRARELLASGDGRELVAFELRRALERLGEILGTRVGPRVLEEIFSRFCVGK